MITCNAVVGQIRADTVHRTRDIPAIPRPALLYQLLSSTRREEEEEEEKQEDVQKRLKTSKFCCCHCQGHGEGFKEAGKWVWPNLGRCDGCGLFMGVAFLSRRV